ncbi:MAG TPA: hypothetical protein VK897_02025, partial [Anaerolineales bacterium]|nr:hypothetical protein [Anaerolineales bacterium]
VHQKLSDLALEAATIAGYTQPIPAEINGFPTDVLQGTYRPQQWQSWRSWWRPTTRRNERATSTDPMRGGISISDEFRLAYGTLGGKVYDRLTGEEMILSNWHVLAGDWRARRGQLIYQPGRLDGGTFANASACLTRDAMGDNLDAAVATLTGRRRLLNEQFGLGPVTSATDAQLGAEVVKSGRSSYITYGRIVEVNSVARMRYGYLERIIRDVIIIDPLNGGEVSRPGDSGSWWLSWRTKQAVGLHFAGSDLPERALAINMPSVLDALNVEIRG